MPGPRGGSPDEPRHTPPAQQAKARAPCQAPGRVRPPVVRERGRERERGYPEEDEIEYVSAPVRYRRIDDARRQERQHRPVDNPGSPAVPQVRVSVPE